MRRTQIYLDDEQDRRLAQRAAITGRRKSEIIRQAIDSYLARPLDEETKLAEFRAAVEEAAGSAAYFTPEYLDKLRDPGYTGPPNLNAAEQARKP